MLQLNKIYNQDCLIGMKDIDTDSVDLIASDPPYQLSTINRWGNSTEFAQNQSDVGKRITRGFMNKSWDVLPSVEILKECLRVLKPGAWAFWMMTPRQDSQMEFLGRLKEAGFIIAFTPIFWTYMSGFPKSANIYKMLSKNIENQLKEKYGINKLEWVDDKN